MPAQPNPYDRLDAYLQELEAHERRRRRNRWWAVALGTILFGLVGGLGYLGVTQAQRPTPKVDLRRFALDTLPPAMAVKVFSENPAPLVVYHPEIGWDTLDSLAAYHALRNRLMPPPPDTTPAPRPQFAITVEGDFVVNEPLHYVISPFDPGYTFVLDFGNGVERIASSAEIDYRYPLPGHFEMHLLLQQGDSLEVLHTLMYEIRRDTLTQASAVISVPAVRVSSP